LNIVLDEAVEEKAGGEKVRIGMVVRSGRNNSDYKVRAKNFLGYKRQLSGDARGMYGQHHRKFCANFSRLWKESVRIKIRLGQDYCITSYNTNSNPELSSIKAMK
jgi:hypothetical protein